jgi:hypothetical protein
LRFADTCLLEDLLCLEDPRCAIAAPWRFFALQSKRQKNATDGAI